MSFKVKPNDVAVITGGGSGIGRAFAEKLAAAGASLILIDKQEDRLSRVAQDIRRQHQVDIRNLTVDLAHPRNIERLAQTLQTLPKVDLFIHCAGFGAPGHFHTVDLAKQVSMLNVHLNAAIQLSWVLIPKMVAQHRGALILVSALYMYQAVPGNAMYGATKLFQKFFGEVLLRELRPEGVTVQVLSPGFTRTHFQRTPEYQHVDVSRVKPYMWMEPAEVIDVSLRYLARGKFLCVPGLLNKFLCVLMKTGFIRPGMVARSSI